MTNTVNKLCPMSSGDCGWGAISCILVLKPNTITLAYLLRPYALTRAWYHVCLVSKVLLDIHCFYSALLLYKCKTCSIWFRVTLYNAWELHPLLYFCCVTKRHPRLSTVPFSVGRYMHGRRLVLRFSSQTLQNSPPDFCMGTKLSNF